MFVGLLSGLRNVCHMWPTMHHTFTLSTVIDIQLLGQWSYTSRFEADVTPVVMLLPLVQLYKEHEAVGVVEWVIH